MPDPAGGYVSHWCTVRAHATLASVSVFLLHKPAAAGAATIAANAVTDGDGVAEGKPVKVMVTRPALTHCNVADAVCQFLRVMHRSTPAVISEHTYRAYVYDLDLFMTYLVTVVDEPDRVLIDDVTGEQVDEVLRAVSLAPDRRFHTDVPAARSRSAASVLRLRSSVTKLFDFSVRKGFVAASPMPDSVFRPTQVTRLPVHRRALSEDDAHALVDTAGSRVSRQVGDVGAVLAARDVVLVQLLAQLGPRVAEVCAFNVDDMSGEQVDGVDVAVLLVRSGKGRKMRELYASPALTRILEDYVSTVRPLLLSRLDAGAGSAVAADSQAAFWLSKSGRRLTVRGVQKRLDALCRSAGVRTTPHGLRHTAATMLLTASPKLLPAIRDLLGHASVSTTGLYLDSSSSALVAAASNHPLARS